MDSDKKIFLFDMDGTLTPAREKINSDVVKALRELSKIGRIGVVTGSDFDYVMQQMSDAFGVGGVPVDRMDILPCNGTKKYVASESGSYKIVDEVNMIDEVGRSGYNTILRFCSRWQASIMAIHMNIPYTGTFLQYRGSLLNWCPVGREAKSEERKAWVGLDHKFNVRSHYAKLLSSKLEQMGIPVTVALGGSTSLDIYPHGWDKTYSLKHYTGKETYFTGDKCDAGGNDWHIYEKLKILDRAFKVSDPKDTIEVINNLLDSC